MAADLSRSVDAWLVQYCHEFACLAPSRNHRRLPIPPPSSLAEVITPRYRALVLLAMFSSLRWGELAALRRSDIDLGKRTIRVTRQMTEVRGSGLAFGPPKSRAGRRVVPIPAVIVPVIDWHLSCFAQDGDDGLVFTSSRGMLLRHSLFRQRVWLPALKSAGLADVHFTICGTPRTCSQPVPGPACGS